MESIIGLLFSSGIAAPSSRNEDFTLGNLSESVQRYAAQLCAAQPELWAKYQTQAEKLHNQERQMEFKRGFLIAAHLMIETVTQKPGEE